MTGGPEETDDKDEGAKGRCEWEFGGDVDSLPLAGDADEVPVAAPPPPPAPLKLRGIARGELVSLGDEDE